MTRLEDVARRAGVSAATASRALSKPDLVARTTRERVVRAAAELGYQPNQLARGLRVRESRTIGVIVTDILNPFHALLAKSIQDAAARRDYTVLLFNSDEEGDKERRALETLRGHRPAGLILVPTARARENLELVPTLPRVELDRASGASNTSVVMVDNVGGARAAVTHLLNLGHRRVGMIAGQLDVTTASERLRGYGDALARAGLAFDPALVVPGRHREEDGRAAAHALLSRPEGERPTALFVGNNEMTVGAVLAARDLGLFVPGDLSIVGFDDSRWAQTLHPALTVVAQPTSELGLVACELLLDELERGAAALAAHVRLGTRLVVRASTAPPRRDARALTTPT